MCSAGIPNIPQMVDIEDDAGSLHDDYPDDCDDYYGLSEDSDKDETILGLVSQIPWWLGSLFLRHFKWNIHQVEDIFNSDPLSLLISSNLIPAAGPYYTSDSCGISDLFRTISQNSKLCRKYQFKLKDRNFKSDLCSICFSSPSVLDGVNTKQNPALATARLFGMSCGHMFCLECWRAFFDVRISSSHVSVVECMAAKCNIRIPDDFIFAILNNPESVQKHRRHILNEVIELFQRYFIAFSYQAHPRLRPCTNTHCTRVLYALEVPRALRVTCGGCGTQFCFACSVEYHAPAHCETIKQWLQKCRDDSGTANYMAAHTKDCPNCGVVIEKNGGCNHMVCLAQSGFFQCLRCQHQFCWVCLGPWRDHPVEYYDCSKYRRSEDSERESSRTRAREYLQRYLFYYERWENHERSLRLEEKHYASIQARIQSKVQNGEGTWIDWQYLLTAAETLRKCRYTLKYTYPYAYCPPAGAAQRLALFEYQQALLEAEVEDLSWKIARAEITDQGALLNKMNICEKHRKTLIHEFY
ncbi:unnamed protein product [Taenia asiatica]|uniref:RBR-type E3 ubiquitin transferase n=1 Tax=Taenia asiatica TaxID=60517 RepID=A0A3P6PYQ5_TAEAS|nr:unnamed protein product [Taenia asiatica]